MSYNPKKIDIYSSGIVLYNMIYGDKEISYIKNCTNFKQLCNAVLKGKYCVKKQDNLCLELVDLLDGMIKNDEKIRYGIIQLINHPFIVKKFEDLTEYNEEDKIYDTNDENNFEIKINHNSKLFDENNEKKDENINKFIDNLFIDEGIIIDYVTKETEAENNWTIVDLNENFLLIIIKYILLFIN